MSFGELEHTRDQGFTLSGVGEYKVLRHAFTTRAMYGASPASREFDSRAAPTGEVVAALPSSDPYPRNGQDDD